jgi:hypothetical protein
MKLDEPFHQIANVNRLSVIALKIQSNPECNFTPWINPRGAAPVQVRMMGMAIECGDDPRDEDWVPAKLRWKREQGKKKGKL